MKPICIIGGGYFGCHIALCCQKWGIPFVIFEQGPDIFTKTSRKNQNRLHQGFHYARSFKTRALCQEGYAKFMDAYAECTNVVDNNLYLVANSSLIDAPTYRIIMNNLGLRYDVVQDDRFVNVEQVIKTNERYINPDKARHYMWSRLKDHIRLGTHITDIPPNTYSCILNCTNNVFRPHKEFKFELTISLVYKRIDGCSTTEGITFVDGPCGSLYPYNISKNLFTLTHVLHTPVTTANTYGEIAAYELDQNEVAQKRQKMEAYITTHMPSFSTSFEYQRYFTSLKCKLKKTGCDERGCYVRSDDGFDVPCYSVICGKITGIFEFERYVSQLPLFAAAIERSNSDSD